MNSRYLFVLCLLLGCIMFDSSVNANPLLRAKRGIARDKRCLFCTRNKGGGIAGGMEAPDEDSDEDDGDSQGSNEDESNQNSDESTENQRSEENESNQNSDVSKKTNAPKRLNQTKTQMFPLKMKTNLIEKMETKLI
ncbi:uncharacterized protein [Amphiura filiformis]|uniref:uncharacterized protein isoform X2 n=1 Tax=Amphiura filiformis TaxID=82378 RepID=UPI003B20FB9C